MLALPRCGPGGLACACHVNAFEMLMCCHGTTSSGALITARSAWQHFVILSQ